MSRENRCLQGAVLLLCLAVLTCPSVRLQERQDQAKELSEFEQRLAKIKDTIKALQARIQDAERDEHSLLTQLDRIGFEKSVIRNELAVYSLELDKTSQDLSSLRVKTAELRLKLEREQKAVAKILLMLYKFGRLEFLQLAMSAENVSAVLAESKHLELLARYEESVISAYQVNLSELRAAEDLQERKKAEFERLVQESEVKRRELEAKESENRALLEQIRRNKSSFLKALAEQNERASQLEALMKKLASQEIVLPFRFVPFYEKKGTLPWPIQGKIVTRFGPERYHNTTTMNNGIEIAPPEGTRTVRAIHPGKVIFADYFQGYGNLLIIDHGLNYYTLYGHCAEFLVEKGDLVNAEQPIAIVGDSGSLKGTSLYLEVRYRTRPLDPLQWLKRR